MPAGLMTANPWEQRIQRARELAGSCAFAAEILEFYRDSVDPMWGKIYHHTLRVNADGTVSPPDVPGHGAEPNYAELEPYRVEHDRVAVGV